MLENWSANAEERDQLPRLTGCERKVLDLVAEAKSNKEIASELGLSPSTIKRHLENILGKLRLKNRVEAAIYALKMHGCPSSSKIFHCPLVAWSVQWTPKLGQKSGRS